MSKLFLSSSGLRNPVIQKEFIKILPAQPTLLKLVYITTAFKVSSDINFAKRDVEAMHKLGFKVTELDIEGKNEVEIKEALEDADIIYMQGGNGFYLLKHLRKSGFNKVLPELLEKGVIYFGASAGTYVACPSIEMHLWKDPHKDTFGVTDLTGLNMVPFLISVHYEERYKDHIKQGMLRSKSPTRILTDDQALYVKDDNVALIGMGDEVRL